MKGPMATRYSREQILCGLQDVFVEEQGCRSPISADMPLDQYLKEEGSWDSLDLLDLIFRIEIRFGLKCSTKEWQRLLRGPDAEERWRRDKTPSPWVTFGELADFIADRVEPISSRPVTFFGNPCETAAAFLRIEEVARQVFPKVEDFGPSTPIRDRFRGYRLYSLWGRLRWISTGKLSRLSRTPCRTVGILFMLGLLGFAGGLIATWRTGNFVYPLPGVLLLLSAVALGILLDGRADPLPADVQTFGDLARRLTEPQ